MSYSVLHAFAIAFGLSTFFAFHLHHGFVFAFVEMQRIIGGGSISAFWTLESFPLAMTFTAMFW